MSNAISSMLNSDTGFAYTPGLAEKFGLDAADAQDMVAPLLGVGIQLKAGVRGGRVCLLHLLYDAAIDIRLPDAPEMHAIAANIDRYPNGFMQRPDTETRQYLASRDGQLANRAMFRAGRAELTAPVKVTEDRQASYSSLPLEGYVREFTPGVGWFAMSVNCELAAHGEYSHYSVFAESNESPADMILSLEIDPAALVEFSIPRSFMEGMRPALTAAVDETMQARPSEPAERYTVIRKD